MAYLRNFCAGALALALLGSAACSGDGGGSDGTDPLKPQPTKFEPGTKQMRRLLSRYYRNSISDIFGKQAAAMASPPPDTALNGFESIASAQLAMTDTLVQRYESSARAVASAAIANMDRIGELMGCTPSGVDDADCFASFVRNTGRLMFRRPVTQDEVDDYVELGMYAAQQDDDAYSGIEWVITAMLQSPYFLYTAEVGEPVDGAPDRRLLTSYEMATRMSLFLRDTTPDAELLDAAEAGDLDTAAGVQEAARHLLDAPTAHRATRSFFEEYLMLNEIETMSKDPNMFPQYSVELAASMKEETLKLLDDIVFERDASVMEMFSADYSFVDKRLADLYGVADPYQAEWTKMSFPIEQRRRGVLSHASIASMQAHTDSTSVTHRGLFIIERFLCRSMPPPPQGVVPELPPSSVAPTMRERVAVHLDDPTCATCHQATDPLGLALENLDPLGRWRDKENGVVIDATAETGELGEFDGVDGLGKALAASPLVSHCLMRQLYRYATGHVETKGELPALDELHVRFEKSGFRFKDLLAEMVASDVYRYIATPEQEEASE